MSRRWLRPILLLVAVALVFAASALLAATERSGRWSSRLRSLWPGGIAPALPSPISCVQDPANVPPPPPGPDGRPASYFHTCGSRILDSRGREVRITGVNWSGMENSDYVPGGLGNRNWQDVLDQVVGLGYNTVRIPFSSEAIDSGRPIGGVNFALNPDLQGLSGLQMLDRLVEGARERGLKVILDRHQPTSAGRTDLWYTSEVPEDRWIADWRMLAARYRGNDTVIAVDLANEPHGQATWGSGDVGTDWQLAAQRAGNAVLDANPYLLVFVEGIENYEGDHFWWGGNLAGVRTAPVTLHVPNRVVYSPHDYGPYVSDQPWFHVANYPRNLPGEWDRHWGYIQEQGIAPVVVGEFGGWSFGNDADGEWQTSLLAYLRAHGVGFLIWSLNPSWDTGGILNGDWQTVDVGKETAYRPLLAGLIDASRTPSARSQPPRIELQFRQKEDGAPPGAVVFAFRVVNDSRTSLDLSRLELRYWFRAANLDPRSTPASVDTGGLPGSSVVADFVPTRQGGQSYYLRVRFGRDAGSIERYRASTTLTLWFSKPNPSAFAPARDYSFAGVPTPGDRFQDWNRVTVYVDGRLAWGQEP